MSAAFKTAEVATMLSTTERNCTAAQIRELKSRHADQLSEGVHWFKDGGATFWTEAGCDQLMQIRSPQPTQSADEFPADCVGKPMQPTQSADSDGETADPIDELAAVIAPNYLEKELSHRVPSAARRLARQVLQTQDTAQPGRSALLSLFPVREGLALPLGD